MFRYLFLFLSLGVSSGMLLPLTHRGFAQAPAIKIALAGDSTVTDDAGWGGGFKTLFQDSSQVLNFAKGGRSSRSFRDEGLWQQCLDANPDYLLIQFGHNDQPGKGAHRESAAEGAFREHLVTFVDEARANNIQPILVTSLTRRSWKHDGTIESTLAEYAEATAAVAAQKQVPLIDLHQLSIEQCEAIGPTAFRALEPMTHQGADHTHLNQEGGLAVAELVVSELIRLVPELRRYVAVDRLSLAKAPTDVKQDIVNGDLRVVGDTNTITILSHDKPFLVYNKQSPPVPIGIDSVYHRSGFLHPVISPRGKVVTATFPADHAHQHGVFSAWVKTTWHDRELDFWNLAKGNARVLHQRVLCVFAHDDGVGFEVDLVHRAQSSPIVDVLRERWKITAQPTDGSYHAFDLTSTQLALTDKPLVVHQYHYGGFAVRGPMAWLSPKDGDRGSGDSEPRSDCRFLNDQGSDRIQGNHEKSRWVSMSGLVAGEPASITVLCHPENLRAPQAARLHPTKPYFCFSPCVDGAIVIDRGHPLHAEYRYLITDSEPDAAWIENQWQAWVTSVVSDIE
jgi:lysophospholipase L1-like esterase